LRCWVVCSWPRRMCRQAAHAPSPIPRVTSGSSSWSGRGPTTAAARFGGRRQPPTRSVADPARVRLALKVRSRRRPRRSRFLDTSSPGPISGSPWRLLVSARLRGNWSWTTSSPSSGSRRSSIRPAPECPPPLSFCALDSGLRPPLALTGLRREFDVASRAIGSVTPAVSNRPGSIVAEVRGHTAPARSACANH
jgi:hypothetical protein